MFKNKGKIQITLTVIAIAAVIITFFTLIGRVEDDTSGDKFLQAESDKYETQTEQIDQMLLEAKKQAEELGELAPAAGEEAEKPIENLPSNSEVEKEVFDF